MTAAAPVRATRHNSGQSRLRAALLVLTLILESSSGPRLPSASASGRSTLVGAWYFAGWWRDPIPAQYVVIGNRDWRPLYPEREPTIGWYDDQQALVDQEIALAADGGLDFFLFDFYTDRPNTTYPGAEQNVNNGLRFFLTSSNKRRMRFAVAYVNSTRYGITDPAEWNEYTDQWVSDFTDPQYLKIGGRPVFVLLDVGQMAQQWGGHVPAKSALDILRQKAVAAGFPGILIGGGLPAPDPEGKEALSFARDGYDFFTAYNGPFSSLRAGEHSYSDLLTLMPDIWTIFQRFSPIPYVPVAPCAYDPRPLLGPVYFGDRTPGLFAQLLEKAKEFEDQNPSMNPGGQKMVVLYAWNELGEAGELIPTKAAGDAYLQQVDAVFGQP